MSLRLPELFKIGLTYLVEKLDIVVGAVIGIRPLPGPEALAGEAQSRLGEDPMAQVDAVLVVLRGGQDQLREVYVARVEVYLSFAS
jgi:hypothetical protein